MQQLNFPTFEYKVKQDKIGTQIFDPVRKKYVNLTPEEWVRQHVIHHLINNHKYPVNLISVEKTINLNGLSKRYDIVTFNTLMFPQLLVECKAPEVSITKKVFEQAIRYNIVLKVPLIVITNGIATFCAKINENNGEFEFLNQIPDYISE